MIPVLCIYIFFKPTASFLLLYDVVVFNDGVDSNMDANDVSRKSAPR